jgi:hypothetical protein
VSYIDVQGIDFWSNSDLNKGLTGGINKIIIGTPEEKSKLYT